MYRKILTKKFFRDNRRRRRGNYKRTAPRRHGLSVRQRRLGSGRPAYCRRACRSIHEGAKGAGCSGTFDRYLCFDVHRQRLFLRESLRPSGRGAGPQRRYSLGVLNQWDIGEYHCRSSGRPGKRCTCYFIYR